jgi:hypothetical protein
VVAGEKGLSAACGRDLRLTGWPWW